MCSKGLVSLVFKGGVTGNNEQNGLYRSGNVELVGLYFRCSRCNLAVRQNFSLTLPKG